MVSSGAVGIGQHVHQAFREHPVAGRAMVVGSAEAWPVGLRSGARLLQAYRPSSYSLSHAADFRSIQSRASSSVLKPPSCGPSPRGSLTRTHQPRPISIGAGSNSTLAVAMHLGWDERGNGESFSSRDAYAHDAAISRTVSPCRRSGGNGTKPKADLEIQSRAVPDARSASVLFSQKLIDMVSRPPQSTTW